VLVAVLALGALAGGGLWWKRSASPPRRPEIADLEVEVGLRRVRVRFRTETPAVARLDISPAGPRLKLSNRDTPATEHRCEASGLTPATAYRLEILVDGGLAATRAVTTQKLLVEGLERKLRLDRLQLRWTTTLAVRSSLVWKAPGQPAAGLDVVEQPGTSHTVEISGLSPEVDYEIKILSYTPSREMEPFGPFAELRINDRLGLVLRPPPTPPPPYQWDTDHLGFDPGLLVPGENVVRIRVLPVPGVTDYKQSVLKFVQLRTIEPG